MRIREVGGGADLENNKTATIDVSAYTEPVEIEPTEGKDGMKKATITLSNIPAGGNSIAYAWISNTDTVYYFNFDIAPSNKTDFNTKKEMIINYNHSVEVSQNNLSEGYVYEKISDNEFNTITDSIKPLSTTFTRDSTKDFTLW